MGDGHVVSCDDAGSPYGRVRHAELTRLRVHVHHDQRKAAGNSYTVTARSYWVGSWRGAGKTGSIRLPALIRSTHIKIGELQVLVSSN